MLNCLVVTNMRRKIFVIALFVLAFVTAFAQSDEYGIPQIKNFGPADYRQESQNFCVVQDKNSLMYFGNTNGVMEYDGEHWPIVKVPGRPKLAVNDNNEIYYGGYNTFGRIIYKNGHLDLDEISNNLDCAFGQIVKVVASNDAVYFASSDKLFMYANSNIKTIIDSKPFRLIDLDGSAYVQRRFAPLQHLNHGKLETDELCSAVDSIDVADLTKDKDNRIIIRDGQRTCFFSYSKSEGLNYFRTEFDRYINKNEYSKMAVLRDGTFVVGTKLGGIVSFDEHGKARFMVNTSNGLKDNSINDIYVDNQNKVWVATENGIGLLETNSGLSIFNSSNGLRGAVLSVIRFNGILYVGTTVGLFKHYRLETPAGTLYGFRSIRGVYENCWQLCIYDNHLYAVTSGGLFDIEEGNAEKVMDGSLISMMPITIGENKYVLLGGHHGIIFTTISEGKIEKIGNMKNMMRTVRTIATDIDGKDRKSVV